MSNQFAEHAHKLFEHIRRYEFGSPFGFGQGEEFLRSISPDDRVKYIFQGQGVALSLVAFYYEKNLDIQLRFDCPAPNPDELMRLFVADDLSRRCEHLMHAPEWKDFPLDEKAFARALYLCFSQAISEQNAKWLKNVDLSKKSS